MSTYDRETEVKRLSKVIAALITRCASGDMAARPQLAAAIARRTQLRTV